MRWSIEGRRRKSGARGHSGHGGEQRVPGLARRRRQRARGVRGVGCVHRVQTREVVSMESSRDGGRGVQGRRRRGRMEVLQRSIVGRGASEIGGRCRGAHERVGVQVRR